MKIKIDIQGRRLTLSPEEARKLFDDLSKVFVVERTIVVQPAPQEPYHVPIYIPIAYPAAPTPLSPPQWEPPGTYPTWCDNLLPCPKTICEAVA